jgi:lysozyme
MKTNTEKVIERFLKHLHEQVKRLIYEIYIEAGMTDGLSKALSEQKTEILIDRLFRDAISGGRMNIVQLRKELEVDEGRIEKIYKDHLGYPTFGIGHLIIEGDPEKGQPIGTPVSAERVNEAFDKDVQVVLADCEVLYPDFYEKPEECQLIIANMMFNMGRTRLSKFKNMKRAVDEEDWSQAANEMRNSRWYRQVTNRAERLAKRMESI